MAENLMSKAVATGWTSDELAEILGVHPDDARRWAKTDTPAKLNPLMAAILRGLIYAGRALDEQPSDWKRCFRDGTWGDYAALEVARRALTWHLAFGALAPKKEK